MSGACCPHTLNFNARLYASMQTQAQIPHQFHTQQIIKVSIWSYSHVFFQNGKITLKLPDHETMSHFPGFPQMMGSAWCLCHFPGSAVEEAGWHDGTFVSTGRPNLMSDLRTVLKFPV